MIRQVEELRTELDPLRFGYLEILHGGKIELRQARANDGISRDIADETYLVTQVGPRHGYPHGKTWIVIRSARNIANAVHPGPADRRDEVVDIEPGVRVSSHRTIVTVGDEIRRERCPSHRVGLRRIAIGHRERGAGVQRQNPVYLPAINHRSNDSLPAALREVINE